MHKEFDVIAIHFRFFMFLILSAILIALFISTFPFFLFCLRMSGQSAGISEAMRPDVAQETLSSTIQDLSGVSIKGLITISESYKIRDGFHGDGADYFLVEFTSGKGRLLVKEIVDGARMNARTTHINTDHHSPIEPPPPAAYWWDSGLLDEADVAIINSSITLDAMCDNKRMLIKIIYN